MLVSTIGSQQRRGQVSSRVSDPSVDRSSDRCTSMQLQEGLKRLSQRVNWASMSMVIH